MSKDYYNILGIDKNASDSDIKKAFRDLSKKWHPDRHANGSEAEKKEAEEKFKDIAEAYGVLSDKEKRDKYDRFGTVDGNFDFSGGFSGMDPDDIINMFAGHGFGGGFGGGFGSFFNRGRARQPMAQPGENIFKLVKLSIEDLFKGGSKTFDYDIEIRCGHCNGNGGLDPCPHCGGTGMVTQTIRRANFISQSTSPCPSCHGTGKIAKNPCKHCNGKGTETRQKSVTVNWNPGVAEGHIFKFEGMGSESKDSRGQNGDLFVKIAYGFDKTKYAFDPNSQTMYELVEIPYYDCIVGCEREIKLPNGKTTKFRIPENTNNEDQITIPRIGINGNNYVVIVKMTMLDKRFKKSDKEKKLLKEIQELHK